MVCNIVHMHYMRTNAASACVSAQASSNVKIVNFLMFQITVYLGKRDFVDHGDHIDPIGESSILYIIT